MAAPQSQSTSPIDQYEPSERELQAARVAKAAMESLSTAADFLELVVRRANKTKYGKRLAEWVDPAVTTREQVAVRDSVLADVVQNSSKLYLPGVAKKREYYARQTELFAPAVAFAARRWAADHLANQAQQVFQLLVRTKTNATQLNVAAKSVRTRVADKKFVLPVMTAEQSKEATGKSRSGGTVQTRLTRMFYMYAIRTGPELYPAETEIYRNLFLLMAHPRGVRIVDEFSKSADTGWTYASAVFSEALTAVAKLQGDLATDETLVWRFPPAIAAGVATMGYAPREALTQFALAWSASRKSKIEQAIEMAGNALMVLDLVGGPLGRAVSEILNFVLAVIGTAVSFLKDAEQDQAAAATGFAERSERLSEGSNSLGTVLQGLAAVAAAVALPGAVSKVIGRKTTRVVNLAESAERRAAREVPDPRGISANPAQKEAINASDRGVSGNSLQGRPTEYTYQTASGKPPKKTGPETKLEKGLSDTPGVVAPTLPKAAPALKNSVPELPLLPKAMNSKNYTYDEVVAFYRANRYPKKIQDKIDALPLSNGTWKQYGKQLQEIDDAIKQVHTDTANKMAGVTRNGQPPFIRSVKGTESNEGARLAKAMTDDKSLTLVGQYSGGTVEFDSIQFVEGNLVEVKQSFRWNVGSQERWVRPEEIMMQLRRQLQFAEEWKRWAKVRWVIRDPESYNLVLGILKKGVGGSKIEPELMARLEVELFR